MPASKDQSAPDSALLSPQDPPPFEIVNGDGAAPLLFLCDHASHVMPKALGTLGLEPAHLERHIAIDIGAAALTRNLAAAFDAPAVLCGYSRLVIDCNRDLRDHTLIREISESTIVPGNRNLSPSDRTARADAVFHPYHAAITARLDAFEADGVTPAIIAVHSFTPEFRGFSRPWHVGILSNRDRRIADQLIDQLAADDTLVVGNNQPYSGLAFSGYTIEAHAIATRLPNAMIEVRQDLVPDAAGIARWSEVLRRALTPILGKEGNYSNWSKTEC